MNKKELRDCFKISDGNLKVLSTILEMMNDDNYRKKLRKLVLDYILFKKDSVINPYKYKFSEGEGTMNKIALSYKRGSITKKLLIEICKENNWGCKFEKDNCVLIYPKI